MLKATAATTAGAALFTGSAQATSTKQINWCGCSQVCVENDKEAVGGGNYLVIRAWETDSDDDPRNGIYNGWAFDALVVQEMPFCRDVEGTDMKIIAVTDRRETIPGATDSDGEYHCNPGTCASKALAAYGMLAGEEFARIGIVDPENRINAEQFNLYETGYTCTTSTFGDGQDDFDGEEDAIDIVQGRCGTPGKDDPSDKDNDDQNNGDKGKALGRN